ncbi:MAG TPA: HypC/HybG/HupF family hydrogenase formation chaperone [Polyangia bacterium]|jgi:hydrogenase expression/formation protein HypC
MCLGIPGEVTTLTERDGIPFASVRFGGVTREVCLACQPDVVVGDFVLVHVGLAIARIDRSQAEAAWEVLQAIGQTSEVDGAPDDAGKERPS